MSNIFDFLKRQSPQQRKLWEKLGGILPNTMKQIPKPILKWSYGITTVAKRRETLLPKTIASLKESGFVEPTLFVDGDPHYDSWKKEYPHLNIVCRYPTIRTFGNWVLSLAELWIRNPNMDRYALFQDDLVCSKNLRKYLDSLVLDEKTYWNLYLFPSNEQLAPKEGKNPKVGFYPSNQLGKGAVALVFTQQGVIDLLTQKHMVTRPIHAGRGWKAVDGGIVTALQKEGYKELVHYPSLIQHTGKISSMGNASHLQAPSFRGEDFDLLTLKNEPIVEDETMLLGDKLEALLAKLGVKQQVEKWFPNCGCTARKKKLNDLHKWFAGIEDKSEEEQKETLNKLLEGEQK